MNNRWRRVRRLREEELRAMSPEERERYLIMKYIKAFGKEFGKHGGVVRKPVVTPSNDQPELTLPVTDNKRASGRISGFFKKLFKEFRRN